MRWRIIRLLFATKGDLAFPEPMFSQEDLEMYQGEGRHIRMSIHGPEEISLLTLNRIVEFVERIFYKDSIEWEYAPVSNYKQNRLVSILQFE